LNLGGVRLGGREEEGREEEGREEKEIRTILGHYISDL
jgi:hypothetical protein